MYGSEGRENHPVTSGDAVPGRSKDRNKTIMGAALLVGMLIVPAVALGLPSLVRTVSPGASAFNGMEIAFADFRGDGHVEVLTQSDNGKVYLIDPRTGGVLTTFSPGNAGCTSTCYSFEGVSGPINAPVVSDLDGDGRLDVVVSNTAAVAARYEFDPVASTLTSYRFAKIWEKRFNQFQSFTTMDATPAVGDLNGDGLKDIIIVVEQQGIFAVRPDGSTLWSKNTPGGHASPSVRDIDLDGKVDVVFAGDQGLVKALTGSSGTTKWTFDASAYLTPAAVPMAPTLTDITGDGRSDVLFMARDAHDSSNYASDHAMMFALDHAGKKLWTFRPSWAAPLSHTRPIGISVGGQHMVLGGDWNTIGHSPGHFEKVGPGHVFLVDSTGHERWHKDLNAGSGSGASNKDLAVADVVGDGSQQVIAPGTQGGKTGLLLFDLASGATKGFLATPTPTRSAAAVGDLFGDGNFAMAVAVAQSGGSVQIWRGTNALSSAFPGWGARSIPAGAPLPPPPPPTTSPPLTTTTSPPSTTSSSPSTSSSSGTFTATFRNVRGNEWWLETDVTAAGGTLASVQARVNGGSWIALTHQSYGSWAKSIHAVAGSQVQFQATSTTGATAVSGTYTWGPSGPA